MNRMLFLCAGLVCLLARPVSLPAQTGVLDQSAEPGNPTIGLSYPVLLSQAVTPETGGRLTEVRFNLVEEQQLDFPYDYATTYLTILDTDPEGRPLSKVIARSEVVGREINFRFDNTPVFLDAGRKYAFQLELDDLISSGQLPLATASQDYPGGDLWLFDHTQVWRTISGTSSNNVPMDLAFQTWMVPGLPAIRLVDPLGDDWTMVGDTLQIGASLAPGAEPGATVEFFANGLSISEPMGAPYQMAWEPQEPGSVMLTAVLSSGGQTFESTAVAHAVLAPTIPNDQFEDAELIAGTEVKKQWYNGSATRQPEEVFFADNIGGRSVWFRWVAPDDGTFTLFGRGLNAANEAFRLAMNVFVGDSIETMQFVAGTGDSIRGTVWFEAEAGQEYRILVDAFSGESGLCEWSLGLRPVNDAFETRQFLPRNGAVIADDNTGATIEPGEPAVNAGGLRRTVWYSWRSPVDADVSLHVRSSEFEPSLRVYRGLGLENVEPVQAVSLTDDSNNWLTFPATTLEAYALQVGSRDDRSGGFEIETTFHTTRFETPRRGQLIELGTPLKLKLDTSLIEKSIDRIDVVANGEILTTLTEPPFEHSSVPSDVGAVVLKTRTHLSDGGIIESDDLEILVYQAGEFPEPRLLGGPFSIQSYVVQASGVSMKWGGLPPETTPNPMDLALHPDWTLVDSGTYIGYSYPQPFDSPVPVDEIQQIGDAWVKRARRTYLLTTDGRLYEDGQEIDPPHPGATWRKFHVATFLTSDGRVYGRENSGMVELTVPGDGSGFRDYIDGFGITRNGTPGRVGRDNFGRDTWFPLSLPEGVSEATALHATAYDYYFLTAEGRLFRWNKASSSQLEEVPAPAGNSSWDRLSCGGFHVLAITSEGNLHAWGRNWEHQLGIGGHHGVEYQDHPVFVRFPEGVNAWLDISAGERHSVAIGDDCNVYTWGDNERWQLGIGPNPNQPRPRKVPSLTQVCGHFELGGGGPVERGVLTFETKKNLTYHVQYSVDGVEWISVVPPIIGTGETVTWQDPDVYGPECPCDDLPVRMYRVANKPSAP